MTQKLRIMVVDDDETTLEVIVALLAQRGHTLTSRSQALGTTLAIRRENPDVVILDVHMPGLSGDRLVGLVAGQSGRSRPLIILHSGSDRAELERLARECGAAGVIEKTGDPLDFMLSFERILADNRPATEAARARPR
jgi:CheY-like chemotaxis protein